MAHPYCFGNVEVRPENRQVLVEGKPASVGARAFDLLLALIERRDRVVTKNELLDVVWPGLVVEENNLQVQVSTLRKLLGPHALATIPGRGYQFAMPLDGGGGPATGSTPAAARATNLPAPTDEIFGRKADIEAAATSLRGHRLVTIVGSGGIGKTRLAQEVTRVSADAFTHGARWVDLAAVATRDQVALAIASAANVSIGNGDQVALLAEGLADREMLLVLDNCEYLASDVAAVAKAILAAAPGVRMLVTSQALLRIAGENSFPLEALGVPPPGSTLERALEFGALRLLESRARAVEPRFALTASNLAHAVELCRHLDGNALAIEMAAARLPMLGLETLVSRLEERLRLLRNADAGATPRQRTLRATLDWSYSLLTPEQQTVLRRLSSFVGTFRLDMAQRVGKGADLDDWGVLDCLAALVDKSLVKIEHLEPPRYRLLETTRLYAMERLAERGESDAALRNHGEAMAALNDEVVRAFAERPESECRQSYLRDYGDLLAAFDRAHERRDAEAAAATVQSLTRLDLSRGFYFPMRHRKQAAFSLVATAGPVAQAKLWHCVALGRYISCPGISRRAAAEAEVAAWRRLGEKQQLYDALARLAVNHGTAGHFEAAETVLAEARAMEDPGWSPHVRALYAFAATVIVAYTDDLTLFASRLQDLTALAQRARSERLLAVAVMQAAELALSGGDVASAVELGPAAIAKYRAIENPLGLANALATYFGSLLVANELESAPAIGRECLPLALQNGVGGWCFDPIAGYAARLGHHETAARLLGFADSQYAAIEEVRRPWDRRTKAQAIAEIDATVGSRERMRLQAAGANLGAEEAEALARDVLR